MNPFHLLHIKPSWQPVSNFTFTPPGTVGATVKIYYFSLNILKLLGEIGF